jgi:hypothetical protein
MLQVGKAEGRTAASLCRTFDVERHAKRYLYGCFKIGTGSRLGTTGREIGENSNFEFISNPTAGRPRP